MDPNRPLFERGFLLFVGFSCWRLPARASLSFDSVRLCVYVVFKSVHIRVCIRLYLYPGSTSSISRHIHPDRFLDSIVKTLRSVIGRVRGLPVMKSLTNLWTPQLSRQSSNGQQMTPWTLTKLCVYLEYISHACMEVNNFSLLVYTFIFHAVMFSPLHLKL